MIKQLEYTPFNKVYGFIQNRNCIQDGLIPVFSRNPDPTEDFNDVLQGYIDTKGDVKIPLEYIYTEPFFYGFAVVGKEQNVLQKFKSVKNISVVNDEDFIKPDLTNIAKSQSQRVCKIGVIDINNNIIIPCKYKKILHISKGVFAIKDFNGKWGIIDKNNEFIVNCKFDNIFIFSESEIAVCYKGKWGALDSKGKYYIDPKFEEIWGLSEELNMVKFDGKYGFIDKTGKFIIEPKFEDSTGFSENVALAKLDNKWGVINKKGEFVNKPKFEDIESYFKKGFAQVYNKGEYILIDELGTILFSSKSYIKNVYRLNKGIIFINTVEGDVVYIDKDGEHIQR